MTGFALRTAAGLSPSWRSSNRAASRLLCRRQKQQRTSRSTATTPTAATVPVAPRRSFAPVVLCTGPTVRRHGAARRRPSTAAACACGISTTAVLRVHDDSRSEARPPPPPPHLHLRLPHDVGGDVSTHGPIPLDRPDELRDWERRCHSLFAVLASGGVLTTDELRRSIEDLTPAQYGTWTYYEKWAAGMASLLLERGVISREELGGALFGPSSRGRGRGRRRRRSNNNDSAESSSDGEEHEPLYGAGDFVRVRPYRRGGEAGSIEWRRPHVRTPGYLHGVAGTVERVCGRHGDPSFLAFGLEAPEVRLYRVRFRMCDVWPESESGQQRRRSISDGADDVVEVEIYEPWLESADVPVGHAYQGLDLFSHGSGSDCRDESLSGGGNDHSHDHNHDNHSHVHEPRPSVEERAALLEGPPRPGRELHDALTVVLLRKGVVTAEEIRTMSERLDTAGERLDGATLVARAWVDQTFETSLLDDAASAAAELGIATSNPNAPTVLTVVKNTPSVHNLVVCTLCSCYPSGLLGIAPSWYKSRQYRSRAVREPREVLNEFGTRLADGKRIRVHDSTADHRYIVLPERPRGTEGWSEADLRKLITRDAMVGVAIPQL